MKQKFTVHTVAMDSALAKMEKETLLNILKHVLTTVQLVDEENKFIQFNDYEKRLKSPFTLFADFKTLNVKLNSVTPDEQSFTENKTIHQVSGFAFYTSSVFHPSNLVFYRGEDAGEEKIYGRSGAITNIVK